MAESLGSVISVVVLIALLAGARAVQMHGVHIHGPKLVLTEFAVSPPTGEFVVRMVGRPEGLVGWVLSAIGVETNTTFLLTRDYVYLVSASLSGQYRETAPIKNLASTHCGFSTLIGLWLLAIFFGAAGLGFTLVLKSAIPFIVGLLFALLCILAYYMSKTLMIAVQTNGGGVIGIKFKQGILDGVPIDIDRVTEVIGVLNQLIGDNAIPGAGDVYRAQR